MSVPSNNESSREIVELRETCERLARELESKSHELQTANRSRRKDLNRNEELEERLRANEKQLCEIIDGMPIPLAITRPSDGRILYVNQKMADLAGIPTNQLIGRTTIEFYEDLADRNAILQLFEADQPVSNMELQVHRLDGSPVWIVLSVQRIVYEGDEAALCAAIDVTTRKQAEVSLRKERRLLQRLLDTHQRERHLTAFEIHDGMVQDMTAAVMLFESLQQALSNAEEKAQTNFEQALQMMRHAIDEARRVIEGLAPPVLEAEGIAAALNSLIDDMSAKSDMSVTLVTDFDGRRFAPALEMSLFRIVQESLNNAWRHGEAKLATIRIKERDDKIRVIIRDFGKGFEVKKVSPSRYGLRGIRERTRLLGGRARIVSVPGKGTLVMAELPIVQIQSTEDEPQTRMKE